VKYRISLQDAAPAKWAELQEARKVVERLAESILQDIRASSDYQVIVKMRRCGSKLTEAVRGPYFEVDVAPADAPPRTTTRPATYIPESTLNTILSVKLLSDRQKRGLLAQQFGGVFGEGVQVSVRSWVATDEDGEKVFESASLSDMEDELSQFAQHVQNGVWVDGDGTRITVEEVWS
jgi:hypothetical protein